MTESRNLKWFLDINFDTGEFKVESCQDERDPRQVYFVSREVAIAALEKFGELITEVCSQEQSRERTYVSDVNNSSGSSHSIQSKDISDRVIAVVEFQGEWVKPKFKRYIEDNMQNSVNLLFDLKARNILVIDVISTESIDKKDRSWKFIEGIYLLYM